MRRTHVRVFAVTLLLAAGLVMGSGLGLWPATVAVAQTAFTIQASADLQPALTTLFEAAHAGEAPAFVESGGDLLAAVGSPAEAAAALETGERLPAYFLPDASLTAQTENADALAFLTFAVSPDGQQALIEAGLLPAVVTVTDQAGRTVDVPQPVRRIASPYSLASYYVYALGAGDRLVSANYLATRDPAVAATLERLDPRFADLSSYGFTQQDMNVEVLASLAPDLVLTSARSAWIASVEELAIPLFLFEGETPDLLREAIVRLGEALGPDAAARAAAWVAYYDAVIARVSTETASLTDETRQRVLFTGTEPLQVASGEMYQTALVQAAGGESVSQDLTGYWNEVNLEQVLTWDPQSIFVPYYGGARLENITESAEWQALPAVTAGQVFRMPRLLAPWDTPVPDSALGILWLAETLYPDQVTFDCPAEVTGFYRTFYDFTVTEEEAAATCG